MEYGLTAHKYHQNKEKVKESKIAIKKPTTEERSNDIDWSEDESNDEVVEKKPEPTAEQKEKEMKSALEREFKQVFKNWRELARGIKWQEEFPELNILSDDKIDSLDHLLKADVGKFLRKVIKSDPKRKKYGYLPKMVTASKGSICTWLASSFCERVNSVANQVVTKVNSLLSPDEIDMLTTLRMNRDFMQFMRESYGHLSLKNLQDFVEGKE